MTWKDQLQKASYKGVEFYVLTVTSAGGHRLNVIDLPESDEHPIEDMGSKNGTFKLSAYVLGDDYFETREKLIKVLEESSKGEFVHPSRGRFEVKCDSWSTVETRDEGRIARFAISFVKKKDVAIISTANTSANIFDKKESLLDKISDWFEVAYEIAQKPITAIEKATETLDAGLEVVRAAKKVTSSAADFQRAIGEMKGRLISYTLNARAMAEDVVDIINYGTDPSRLDDDMDLTATAKDQVRELKDLQTQMGGQLVANAGSPSDVIQQMMSVSSIAAETGLMSVVEYNSPSDAIEEEKNLINRYDDLINTISPTDELYDSIRDIQQALHEDLEQRIIDLPRNSIESIYGETNLLKLMSSVYGDLDDFDEFISRNEIIHPGFVPAVVKLSFKVRVEE